MGLARRVREEGQHNIIDVFSECPLNAALQRIRSMVMPNTLSRLACSVVLGQSTLAIWVSLFRRIVTNEVARGQFYVIKLCKEILYEQEV